jgi:hypothetical protein
LLVASSKSFPAVNREQFYVSISRGRESVQVFTDDSELLARRVTDSHERKAAVELTELRQELAKLGFTRKEPLEEETAPPTMAVHKDFRTVRPMRFAMGVRPMRFTRLPLVQWLAQVVEDVRHWVLAQNQSEAAKKTVETPKPVEALKEAEKISPATRETPRVRPSIKTTMPPPRQSRGIRM